MNALLFSALQVIIKAIVGAINYESVQILVKRMESTNLSGDEKRAAVV